MHTLINRDTYKGKQSLCLTSYYDVTSATGKKRYRVKLDIERDAIYYQSHARSYVWNDVGWEFVCFIPVDFLNLEGTSVYKPLVESLDSLLATEKELLRRTNLILL